MQENQEFTIGQLATLSGCSVQIVRHYEVSGLLPAPLAQAEINVVTVITISGGFGLSGTPAIWAFRLRR